MSTNEHNVVELRVIAVVVELERVARACHDLSVWAWGRDSE